MADTATSGFLLSSQQKYLWPAQAEGGLPNSVLVTRVEGPVHPDRLRDAVSGLISRHEVLRTVFHRVPGMKLPFQVVLPGGDATWETLSVAGLNEAAQHLELERLVSQ